MSDDTTTTETGARHTPGPWRKVIAAGETVLLNDGTCPIGSDDGQAAVAGGDDPEANADRIIACVNACEGINPKAVPVLLAAVRDLLAAELYARRVGVTLDDHLTPSVRIGMLEAAIAKAEGGAA